jgi:3-deoxy-D-manno-octulosonic-acid transferase
LQIVLTFYSPSGYEVRKNTPLADLVMYLGPDKPHVMSKWVSALKPSLFITVKYEVWPNLFLALYREKVPIYMLSAIFRKNHRYFGRFSHFWIPILQKVTHFYVQNELSATMLKKSGIDQVSVIGDTRYDRVISIARQAQIAEEYKQWIGNKPVLIIGSSYAAEESVFRTTKRMWRDRYKLIIAPHHIDEDNIQQILLEWAGDISLATELKTSRAIDITRPVLLLNTMGELGSVYSQGILAVIGGGWGKGIHNTLEPAAHGLAVVWGPEDGKFDEAGALLKAGGAKRFKSPNEMRKWLMEILERPDDLKKMGQIAREHVVSQVGATNRFIEMIAEQLRE